MYCQKCQVTITASEHQCIDAKVCATCGEEKPIKEFPVHPSSFDGHRRSCMICVEKEKTQRRDHRIQVAQQHIEQQAKHEQENALFRAYGYYWKKEMVEAYDDWEEDWVLHAPTGAQITTQDALQEIAALQVYKPGHPSTLWAYDLLSLSHPLVLVLDTETTGFGGDSEGYRNMKLAAACLHFQIEQITTHRALADAQVSLGVLHKLAALYSIE